MKVNIINTTKDAKRAYLCLIALLKLHSINYVGFDAEFVTIDKKIVDKATYIKENFSWLKNNTAKCGIGLIQIAIDETVFLLNFASGKLELPKEFIAFLESDKYHKCGVGIKNDLNILSKNFGISCKGAREIPKMNIVRKCRCRTLKYLSNIFLGIHLCKGKTFGDWGCGKLTKKMIQYASMDAIASYKLYDFIINNRKLALEIVNRTKTMEKFEIVSALKLHTLLSNVKITHKPIEHKDKKNNKKINNKKLHIVVPEYIDKTIYHYDIVSPMLNMLLLLLITIILVNLVCVST